MFFVFFFNDTATTEIYTLSLHDALPICSDAYHRRSPFPRKVYTEQVAAVLERSGGQLVRHVLARKPVSRTGDARHRSEEHTSELQSRQYLVCRLLLEKKKKHTHTPMQRT